MKYLHQKLHTSDDSFTYTVMGETEPHYRVDCHGYLMRGNDCIGKFTLRGEQWHLIMDGVTVASGPEKGLHKLPEFELKALTDLYNAV